VVTLFLGLAVGSTMRADSFLRLATLKILVLGILAFALDTAAGILFAKTLNALSGGRFNPLLGAAGSAPSPWPRASSTALASRRTSRTSSSCTRWAPTRPARSRAWWPRRAAGPPGGGIETAG